ncbi:glycosyltransferase family 8 protein [Myxacorys almedinensis]|uniref:Glycosyltransferase family 8 protein n=1 Tax=Myxacorys almedinensis A TaxID=2690445 RepID=A0A8J8CJP1_9CYAN|nr:glycosyltransferase family 8 protein [Myxacorys almedinensis]NDJ17811.1 glycosyltransferase family 8 protein [Myxacorys almedinensis A]
MKNSTDPIVVACAADDFFAMPLAVTACSMVENLNPDCCIDFYVLDGGIKQSNKEKIIESLEGKPIEIHWVKPCSDYMERLYFQADSTYPISAYYRLLLPEIIPDRYQKVIYLDTDVILLEDIAKLWNLDLGEYYMLAAMDAANQKMDRLTHLKHLDLDAMGVSREDKYLQSGVLLIDLNKWRADQISDKLLDFIANHLELPYPDMDALNFVLAGKWGELDPRWNQIPVVHSFASWESSPYTQEQLDNTANRPFIIHYGSKPKPWDQSCTHPQQSLWYDYLHQTAWSGWENTLLEQNILLMRRIGRRLVKSTKKLVATS